MHKEYDTYIRTIIARYVSVWYYPIISTDQEFPEDLMIVFHIILNRFSDRFKSLNSYDLTRLIMNLQQKHVEEYLRARDSYLAQRKPNRISKSLVEEFGQTIGFHRAIANNDIHAYLKALTELLLTDLIPESFHIYSNSRLGREFVTQIIVNCIFLPILNQFSKPQTLYYLIVLLWETEEQAHAFEHSENSPITQPKTSTDEHKDQPIVNEQDSSQPTLVSGNINQQIYVNNEHRPSHLERIIYSATIIASDTAYDPMFGTPYTVYSIQCETKSPFIPNATHQYTINRRFREFMNLHKRLQKSRITSPHCDALNENFRKLPIPIDSMNPNIIQQRKVELEKYIQKLISNEVLNCSHDVLEFFAFNSDHHAPFEMASGAFPVPRVDKVLMRTLSDMGNHISRLRLIKRQYSLIQEKFQLNVSTAYENISPVREQLKLFVQQSSLRHSSYPLKLNSVDLQFLETLITRPSILTSSRNKKTLSDIPLTDAALHLIYTSLHSRDTIIRYQSIHDILRIIFGHLIEEFLKTQIDDILSRERIIVYLVDLRTKVLWSDDNQTVRSMSKIKERAFNACINKIPKWLQQVVGEENARHVIKNLLECLSYEQLNKHFLCNFFDLLIEQFIPDITKEDFLKKYVQMHAGSRS